MIAASWPVPMGLLLPQSTLEQTWFSVLATVVAFNTIIYVGLTLSKVIPWPRQIHPSRVRAILVHLPFRSDPEVTVPELVTPEVFESEDPYEALRRSVARRQIPQAFALLGGLVLLLSAISWLNFQDRRILEASAELVAGLLLLLAAQVLSRRGIGAPAKRWLWVVTNVLLICLLLREAVVSASLAPVAYALVVMTMFVPITLAWRPAMTGAALMLLAMVVAGLLMPGITDGRLVAAALGALLGGCVLLRLRLSAIDELADERSRSMALASTDTLTGALSRQGLLTLLPGLASMAERTGQAVCVMLFDVDGLGRANHEYGTHYGDDVLQAVYAAINATVRRGDLVSRWGGDEFVVAGLGNKPGADSMASRIQERIRASGVGLGKWPISVSVSTASGLAGETTFEALLDSASTTLTKPDSLTS